MYRDDGEIHVLTEDYAYILKFVKDLDLNDECSSLQEIQLDFYRKYAEYLYSFDKEKIIEMVTNELMSCHFLGSTSKDIQFIFRPSHMMNPLDQQGSLALKFKRSKNDNLGNLTLDE